MTTTTTKRGSGTKFLALLASLTMMIAGLVGVALAAPASADAEKVWICHADTNNGNGGQDLGHGQGGENKNGFNLIETAYAAWDKGHQDRHPNDRVATESEVEQGYCGPRDTRPVYWCDGGEGEQEYVQKEWEWAADSPKPAEGIEWSTNESAAEEECSTEPVPTASATITCSAWSVDLTNYLTEDEEVIDDLTPRAQEGDEVVVKIDGTTVFTGEIGKDGSFKASGVIDPAFADDATHTVTVEVDGEEVKSVTSSVCPAPKVETCVDRGDCPQNDPPVVTEEPPAPVVAAAVVEAPAPATVAAPAPATVAVPAAATLPAAVPAGEGSDTGLPMWALAMVAAGMIGAAFAGKQLLGARK